ncbi:uncharacterized protein RJT21DRAFT_110927 [Scheffersomyces amazonensis]|uniref:uncharacterized protein n=1 Tax=Scheffersomyces amazonensis TaxID=1078765 RepID=UPI00315D9CB1
MIYFINKTHYIMGSSVSSNKSNWWVYLVVFLGFICFYLRYWIGRSSVDPLSTIIKTSTFEQLIQCSDINDSLECFNNFKGDLIDEVKTSIDSVSRFQLQK